jgi:hypothetical protein
VHHCDAGFPVKKEARPEVSQDLFLRFNMQPPMFTWGKRDEDTGCFFSSRAQTLLSH